MAHEYESTGGIMEPPRRSFLYKAFTVVVGAVLPLPAIAAALGALVNPLRPVVRQKQAPSGSVPLGKDVGYFATLDKDALQRAGSEPVRFAIIADRKDAWNVYPKSQIGAVWVQKISQSRLDFEQHWKAEKLLRSVLDKAPTDQKAAIFEDLLEVEFSMLKREKEQAGKEWTPGDGEKARAHYAKVFSQHKAVVDKVAAKPAWEGAFRVFNHSCPHAGCAVDFKKDDSGKPGYFCPCHDSVFGADGARSPSSPSPRGLDRLRHGFDRTGTLCVKYQEFKAGHEEQEAV